MAIEIVDFPIKNGGSFHSYVSLPEGNWIPLLAGSNRHVSAAFSEALKSPEAGKVSHALSAGSIVSAGELLARRGVSMIS